MTTTAWAQVRRYWLLILAVGVAIGLSLALQPDLVVYVAVGLAALGALAMVAMSLFRAPEVLFALFMSVGSFKAGLLPVQETLGIDFTLALLTLVVVGTAIKALRGGGCIRLHWPIFILYLLLAAWMSFSMVWSPTQEHGLDKSARFATLTLLAFAGPMFLLDTWPRLERFLGMLFLLGMLFTTQALVSLYLIGQLERLVTVLGADYLTLGRVCGSTVLIGVYFLVRRGTKWWLRLVLLACVGAAVLVVFLGGARGPLVGWIFAFLFPLLLRRRRHRGDFLALGIPLIGVVLFGGAWALGLLPHDVTWRFKLLFAAFFLSAPWAVPLVPRIHIWQVGLDMFFQHPLFGAGVQAYRTSVPGGEVVYPHNLFLEAGAELGLVGLVLVLCLIIVPLVMWRQRSKLRLPSHHLLLFDVVLWVYWFFFVEAMKSGDFNGNRTFWMSIGLVISVCLMVVREVRTRIGAGGGQVSQQVRSV